MDFFAHLLVKSVVYWTSDALMRIAYVYRAVGTCLTGQSQQLLTKFATGKTARMTELLTQKSKHSP